MHKEKKIILFIIFFCLFLFWNLIVTDLYADEVWNYGFSKAIYDGLVPYKDFNMVIPPLYPMLNAFFFKIFGPDILVLHIVNALIITFMCYLLYLLIDKKFLILLLLFFLTCTNMFPNYNLFILFLFILLIFLEKKNTNDILIGFIIGISIITKQTIGLCLILPSLLYIKDSRKILKRFIGIIIPCIILLIYLLLQGNFNEFMDLCVFGLFDFTKNNSNSWFIYILSFIYLIICFIEIKRNSKNINNYYALAMFSMIIPLFDFPHFQISLFCLLLILFINHDIKIKINIPLFFFGIVTGISIIQLYPKLSDGIIYPNKINHLEYRFLSKAEIEYTNVINEYLNKNNDREVIFLTNNAYYFRIIRDEKITKVDLINYGNHGYHGSDKLLKLIKSKTDALFIIDKVELNKKRQTDKRIIHYVMEHGKKIDEINTYEVYELK